LARICFLVEKLLYEEYDPIYRTRARPAKAKAAPPAILPLTLAAAPVKVEAGAAAVVEAGVVVAGAALDPRGTVLEGGVTVAAIMLVQVSPRL
jgi:hypothetical protein